jgi:hypothetical protein
LIVKRKENSENTQDSSFRTEIQIEHLPRQIYSVTQVTYAQPIRTYKAKGRVVPVLNVFPVRYELNSYILFRRNSVFKK